jgi:hypothetical protein
VPLQYWSVFAFTPTAVGVLAVGFVLAGIGIADVETAQAAAVRRARPDTIRGSAFSMLATVQADMNVLASAVAGLLYTIATPTIASFCYLAAWMLIALAGLTPTGNR